MVVFCLCLLFSVGVLLLLIGPQFVADLGSWLLGLLLFAGSFNVVLILVGFAFRSLRRRTRQRHSVNVAHDVKCSFDSGLLNILREPEAAAGRTAVVMAIFNEKPLEVHQRARRTWESIRLSALERQCDFYLLSDSSDAGIQIEEDEILQRLRDEFCDGGECAWRGCSALAFEPVNGKRESERIPRKLPLHDESDVSFRPGEFFLLRRNGRKNFKAGNIANFLEKRGHLYEFMLVLDADSLMEGETIRRMIDRMKAQSDLAILQSTILPTGAVSLFSRSMQFSLRRTMPLYARGLYWFFGRQSVFIGVD